MEYIVKYFPDLEPDKQQKLQRYMEQLLWWNARINLISRQDTEELELRHVLHALAIAKTHAFQAGSRILDLGTGGGLPGIPLAILFPASHFTLIDGRGKKIKAVQAMTETIGLKNTTALHTRAEDYSGDFDVVVSRAVAPLKELWDWSEKANDLNLGARPYRIARPARRPFGRGQASASGGPASVEQARNTVNDTSPGFSMIVLKGGDLTDEIKALGPKVAVKVQSVYDLFPEDFFREKWVVEVSKT